MTRPFAIGFFLLLTQVLSVKSYAEKCEHDFYRPSYKTRSHYCSIGQMVTDQYEIGKKVLCEDIEVDHLISLYYAYSQGVCGDDLKRLANDPKNLRFTHRQTNRSKGSKSPEEFALSLQASTAKEVNKDADILREKYGLKPISVLTADQQIRLLTDELESSKVQIGKLASISPKGRDRIVRYKNKAMPLSDAVNEHTTAVRRRLVKSAQRNLGAMPAEALPWFGVSVIAAATAWEMWDTCEALKDNYELALAFNSELELDEDVTQVCATKIPTRDEILSQIVSAPNDIWTAAKSTFTDIEIAAPTLTDIGAYLVSMREILGELGEKAKNQSFNVWNKAITTFWNEDD